MSFRNFQVPYPINEKYSKKAAYFSMEFAIHQPLKIYSGGLGFLAGSHLRSAFELNQNMIGIGMLWKYGYYDQARNQDQTLQVSFMEKMYSFLEDTGIKYQILIHDHPVWVKAYYLAPNIFCSAPLFLLSTDLPENDYVSQTITHRLYDANVATKVAQFILLGVGGAKLIDELNFNPEVYHLNEKKIYETGWEAMSYEVNSEALLAMSKFSSEKSLDLARNTLANNPRSEMNLSCWQVLAKNGSASDLTILVNSVLHAKAQWREYGLVYIGRYAIFHNQELSNAAISVLFDIHEKNIELRPRCLSVLNYLKDYWTEQTETTEDKASKKDFELRLDSLEKQMSRL